MVTYTDQLDGLSSAQLRGFFVDWPQHPTPEQHLEILRASYRVWLAMDGTKCVGFINAISDGNYSAFIPMLEVLPDYQTQGIGSKLVQRMTQSLEHLYSIDAVCDPTVTAFYTKNGYTQLAGMAKRNYENQAELG